MMYIYGELRKPVSSNLQFNRLINFLLIGQKYHADLPGMRVTTLANLRGF
jgi:hypothetical protein